MTEQIVNLSGTEKINFIREVIAKTEGRWFSADNVKKTTGEPRTWKSIRVGVKAYVTGVGLNYDPKRYNLQGVWEPASGSGAEGYRMLDLPSISRITADGTKYIFVN